MSAFALSNTILTPFVGRRLGKHRENESLTDAGVRLHVRIKEFLVVFFFFVLGFLCIVWIALKFYSPKTRISAGISEFPL